MRKKKHVREQGGEKSEWNIRRREECTKMMEAHSDMLKHTHECIVLHTLKQKEGARE